MNALHQDLTKLVKIVEKASKKESPYRLYFHLMPPVGWLNDPNGLCQYRGRYHVFFQYAPFDVRGGVKMWGHYVSQDFIHWEYLGVPLLPDQPFDCHGVYSGSALSDDGNLELYYTGNVKFAGDFDYIQTGRGADTIRVVSGDGICFEKKQVVINHTAYPQTYTCHVRDPKVWKRGKLYYMALGARSRNSQGSVLLYQSENKIDWDFWKEITTKTAFGFMWECPDLFELDGAVVLSVSPQGLTGEKYRFQNLYQSGYFIAKDSTGFISMDKVLDKAQFYADENDFIEWDMGFDFYAPQTFLDETGRRILIGWAGMPDVEDVYDNQPTIEEGWQHALTVPRELIRKENRILQYPVEELLSLREEPILLQQGKEYKLQERTFDLEIDNPEGTSIVLQIEDETFFSYDAEANMARLGFVGEMGRGRKLRQAKTEKMFHLRVLVDTSLMEIYINHGEIVFTTRYYPKQKESTWIIKQGGAENRLYLLKCRESVQQMVGKGGFT